ncbi:glycosyltransferase family 4 protein [Amycolatopsis anabasis]|uniref:glycosyltransferase family 4 protein n=1 Tax=Amycolatopsis anabasis TaxID=1840409 RepID=UPI00131C50EA|nr:glycosyltransferase family 4 protein [Amycolatopsis anabasis]
MRIAYVLTQDRGGPVDVTVRLAATLLGSGAAEVRVFGPVPARGAKSIAGHHEEIAVTSKGNLAAVRSARRAIRAWRPDVVHAQDRRSGLVCAGMRNVVHTYHGVPDDVGEPWFRGVAGAPGPSRYTRAVLAADAVVARAARRTVVPAPVMGEFLRRRLRVPAHRLVHIDNCVDLPPVAVSPGPVRRLVFVGLLVERKGILDLLRALSSRGVLPPGAGLTIAGDGPLRAEAESLAAPLGDRVRFLGFHADVPGLLAAADALVLPSTMEQQPLVVAEAMAAGKLVLATDTGGVADMLDVPGAARYLAAPGEVGDLAARLRELFADPDPVRTGRLLAARARERFSPEACADAHLELYRGLS